MDTTDETIIVNGMHPKEDEMKWNHKKKTKDRFLLFCETVLNHERELLSETLNSSSQESISENLAPEGQNNSSIENSTFNSDSDGGNAEISSKNFTNDNEDGGGGGGGDSFNSVTCFCGKPFAGRPMIECSSCLTWLHMSCVKVKRKNIPEFYYCDSCKSNGTLLSPSSNAIGNSASSGEETIIINNSTSSNNTSMMTTPTARKNGTISSNNSSSIISPDVIVYAGNTITHQNNQNNTTKSRKPKSTAATVTATTTAASKKKVNASLMMNSSDNIKNNANSDSKYLTKKSSNVNGKLKKIRQTTKKMRPHAISSSSLAAAASLTALSQNHVSPIQTITSTTSAMAMSNGSSGFSSENSASSNNILKSPIATNINNNIYSSSSEVMETQALNENGAIEIASNVVTEKFNNKRLKLL